MFPDRTCDSKDIQAKVAKVISNIGKVVVQVKQNGQHFIWYQGDKNV